MAAIFGEGKIFFKLARAHSSDTLWVENFDEIALFRTVKEIEANLCFAIFAYHRPNLGINPTKKIGWRMLYHTKPPAKYERNLERNVDRRSLTSNIPHFRHFCLPQA